MSMKMNILVTGGAGYIGSVTVYQLVEAGHNVFVYDNLSRGHRAALNKDAQFIKGDISNTDLVVRVLKDHRIEAVVHFAAFIEAGESMRVPERYFSNNTINTLTLLEAMLFVGVNKFVFSSTAAVYGDPKNIPISEDASLIPTNAYGASKLMIEQALYWYHKIHGLQYAALRYFNACGVTEKLGEDHQPETHLIPLAIQTAMGKRDKLHLGPFGPWGKEGVHAVATRLFDEDQTPDPSRLFFLRTAAATALPFYQRDLSLMIYHEEINACNPLLQDRKPRTQIIVSSLEQILDLENPFDSKYERHDLSGPEGKKQKKKAD